MAQPATARRVDVAALFELVARNVERVIQGKREVIQMAYFDGYSQSEIAVALDIPLGTVKTRTSRGLQRLAGLLQKSREQS